MELRKNLLTTRLPPTLKSAGDMTSKYQKRSLNMQNKDYSPILWMKYFERSEDVEVNESKFRIYRSGDGGPVLLLLHGGGFSALTWALFSSEIMNRVVCQTIAMDLRGHGDTVTNNDEDLSIETLAADVGGVIGQLYGEDAPPVIIVGHSMGGAVAVHAASSGSIRSLAALCVIDVVEGTAMQALASMQSYLRGRPKNFRSIEHAIEWAYRSGHTRNLESARVSMPGQLKNLLTGSIATNDLSDNKPTFTPIKPDVSPLYLEPNASCILEEDAENQLSGDVPCITEPQNNELNFKSPGPSSVDIVTTNPYTWRIDLSKTEVHWPGWFRGLSDKFLNQVASPKLLLLANINGLDTDLTVGQMQGKFQMQVLARCGHAVQEDVPDQVADVLASFLLRNRLTTSCGDFVRTFPTC